MALAKTGRRRRKFGWAALLLVLAVGVGGYAAIARPWETRPLAVKVETMVPGPLSQVLAVNGRVAAKRTVAMRSPVQARAISVLVDVGDAVTAGQLLAQLDTSQQKLQVDQTRAALDAGQVRRDQARTDLERAQALGDNVTRATLDNAETAFRAAENEVSRLQAALDQSENLLEQYSFRAPFDGVVLERGAEEGQLVDLQSQLFTIADLSELLVETDVDELYSSQVRTGLAALLKPAGGTASQSGKVTFAAPSVDPQTGGRAIKISFDVPVSLPIGLTVNANVIVAENADALSVQRGALVTEGARAFVLVVKDGIAEERDVRFVDWPADRLEITEGLVAGEQVILDPSTVTPGQAVTPSEV